MYCHYYQLSVSRHKCIVLLWYLKGGLGALRGSLADQVILDFLKCLDAEHVLNIGECHFIKDLSGSHPLVLKEFFSAEVLRHTMASLRTHVFALLVHELIGPSLARGIWQIFTLAV